MKDIALLIGNGVNSMSKGILWKELLHKIIEFCDCPHLMDHEDNPFPLFYEEIFLTWAKDDVKNREVQLKKHIGKLVSEIKSNDVHDMIKTVDPAHIMTVNYEFLLEGRRPERHAGLIVEKLYSIFRKYEINGTSYWHLHGDCRNAMSINLGYEHYSGQLQKMRNYVTSNTDYKSKLLTKKPLAKRLKAGDGNVAAIQSWIDLFFVRDVHIIGMTMDFVEADLWWLITYRGRQLFYKKDFPVNNRIFYYMPEKYVAGADFKIKLLEANGVTVVIIDKPHDISYYKHIFDRL